MYNRVGQTLFLVGRQFTRKLCKTARNNGIGTSYHATNVNSKNLIPQRNYCDGSSAQTSNDVPVLLPLDEVASTKLKDFLASPENERIYKVIQLEVEVLRQNNERVPDVLKPRHWWELVQLDSRSKRKRYLDFVWTVEKKKENQREAKEEKRKLHEETKVTRDTPYRLGDNSMFLRIYETTMNHKYNGNLMNAILYGQPVVMDCSYESYMTRKEIKYCARQLKLSFSANRVHDDPFNMYLCNANVSGDMMTALQRFIPTMYDVDFPLNVTSESYLDVFDKSRLVYLTPHCQHELMEFDYDAVYIVGAFVDKASNEPVSLAKAKKEGIKMAKFPLDRYLQWGCSSGKNLTLNAVLNILLDLRLTKSWEKALQHVPRRKLFSRDDATSGYSRMAVRDGSMKEDGQNHCEPLQVPKAKFSQRYNADSASYMKSRLYGRSNYQRNGRNDSNDTLDVENDFSLAGRRMKKNWKN